MASSPLEVFAGRELDALVVGGGLTGAAGARELALRGARVGLLEQSDFGWGASGRSARLVFAVSAAAGGGSAAGGVVRRAVDLVRAAPHLFRPTPVINRSRDDRSTLGRLFAVVRRLSDRFAASAGWPEPPVLSDRHLEALLPGFAAQAAQDRRAFFDGLVDDRRLALALALDARRSGVLLAPNCQLVEIHGPSRRAACALVRDRLTGQQAEIPTRSVINATGAALDVTRRLLGMGAHPRVRSIHRQVRCVFGREIEAGLVLDHPRNGRRVIVAPVEGGMLASVVASAGADRQHYDDLDAAWIYCAEALRPLAGADLPAKIAVVDDDAAPQGGLWRDEAGGIPVWSVLSAGPLYAEDAAIQCADAVTKELKPFPLSRSNRRSFLPGGDIASVAGEEAAARAEGLEPAVARWLVRRYGGEWRQVAEAPGGLEAVGSGDIPVQGEIAWAVEREELRTLSSLLARWRLPEIAPDAESLRAIGAAAESALAQLLDWSPARREREHARWEEDRCTVWAAPPGKPSAAR